MGRKSSKKNTQTTAVEVINNIQEVEVMGTTAVETTAVAVEVIDSKEEAVMGTTETTAVATIEAQATETPATEGPKEMLLFTASRGNNSKFTWNEVTVNPEDKTRKVRGCAIELPLQVAEIIGTDKFVSYIEKATIEKCVEEQRAVRGTASTFSDVYTRYCKVTDTKGERVAVALEVFKTVLEAIKEGTKTGTWARPEEEKEETTELAVAKA